MIFVPSRRGIDHSLIAGDDSSGSARDGRSVLATDELEL